MKSILLVTPVFRRFRLTEIMLRHRVKTLELAREQGVECQSIIIGDEENVTLAHELGFLGLVRDNVLGSKYNDGHEYALKAGYDVSLHCNSDQVFRPELLYTLAYSPYDRLIRTKWLTLVDGRKSLTFRCERALNAFPKELLRWAPRPCAEYRGNLCDSSAVYGVLRGTPDAKIHEVELGPLEMVQFQSGNQMTSWLNWMKLAVLDGRGEIATPWSELEAVYGSELINEMKEFYGL